MQKQHRLQLIIAALVALYALYCYNPFVLWFQNDDFIHIPLSANGELLQRNSFRPVCDISIMVDYWLWGKEAYGYHLTNLLLHLAASTLLFFLMRLILEKYFYISQTKRISLFSAILFFIYAMHSESVFWILGRSSVLALIFSICFLYSYLKRFDEKKFIGCYIVSFILCLLTYESTWVLLPFCLLISFIESKQRPTKQEWFHIVRISIIFFVYLLARYSFIHEIAGEYEAAAFHNGDIRTILVNYLVLLLRTIFPFFDNDILLLCGFAASFILLVILFRGLEKKVSRKILLLSFFFFISLIPYCSLGIDTHGTESERFLYLPEAILCIIIGIIIQFAKIRLKAKLAVAFFIFLLHMITLTAVSNNYFLAGKINRIIVQELEKSEHKKIVYVEGLPQVQYGALILRDGLPQLVQWMAGNTGIDSAIICSQRNELQPLQDPYDVIYSNENNPGCRALQNEINPKNFILFRFTDSVLYINN